MVTSNPGHSINCTQCGGELHPDEGQIFLTCPFCLSTVYLDKSQVVFHWYLAPTLDEERARAGALRKSAGELEGQSHPPTVPLEAALGWLRERRIPTQDVAERALVHLPLYTFKYMYQGNPYTAMV